MRRNEGFTLLELMVSLAILSIILTAGYIVMLAGQNAWIRTDAKVTLQENARQTLLRISKEVRESGTDKDGNLQVFISDGAGVNGTDILRFSIPLCVCSSKVMNTDGDVAAWGAPLNWGFTGCPYNLPVQSNGKVTICHLPPGNPGNTQELEVAPSAVNDHLEHGDWVGPCTPCTTDNNKFIEYLIDVNGRLLRRVLNDTTAVVKQDIFAQNITDFQVSLSADQDVVTLTATVTRNSPQHGLISNTRNLDVFLRNN